MSYQHIKRRRRMIFSYFRRTKAESSKMGANTRKIGRVELGLALHTATLTKMWSVQQKTSRTMQQRLYRRCLLRCHRLGTIWATRTALHRRLRRDLAIRKNLRHRAPLVSTPPQPHLYQRLPAVEQAPPIQRLTTASKTSSRRQLRAASTATTRAMAPSTTALAATVAPI